MQVETIETPELGDRSYVVHADGTALVVDPQRDLDRLTPVLAGLTVSHVVETHRHNDYVTGGYALAQQTGAVYVVPGDEDVVVDRLAVGDGDAFEAGPLQVRVVATPGHTEGHNAYVVTHGAATAVFTGGSLLFGSVGRTDLVDPARTAELTRAQYQGVRRLAADTPADAAVYPTHGFGSFLLGGRCGGPPMPAPSARSGPATRRSPPTTKTRSSPTSSRGSPHTRPTTRTWRAQPRGTDRGRPDAGRGDRRHRAPAPAARRRVGGRPAQPRRVRRRAPARDGEHRARPVFRHVRRVDPALGRADHAGRHQRRPGCGRAAAAAAHRGRAADRPGPRRACRPR